MAEVAADEARVGREVLRVVLHLLLEPLPVLLVLPLLACGFGRAGWSVWSAEQEEGREVITQARAGGARGRWGEGRRHLLSWTPGAKR